MQTPKTEYARRGEISIAYQVLGEGPIDVVIVNGLVAHMDLFWIEPEGTAMLQALGSFSRLILFDKPGTGLSDPVAGAPTLEERTQDIVAVMDAVGSERAVILGYSEGGCAATVFAATYPARTEALILLCTGARLAEEPAADFLPGEHDAWRQAWKVMNEMGRERWGSGSVVKAFAPSWVGTPMERLAPIAERACASPGMVRAILDSLREYDIRALLPTISVPSLVLHASDEFIPAAFGRDLAARIPNAKYVEFLGRNHLVFANDWRPVIAEIEEFLTGNRPEPEPDRLLQTILFTDIVGSTEQAARLGDREWRRLLGRHDQLVHEQLARHGGRPIKNLGDGFFATFDGAARAVRCGREITAHADGLGIEIRAGVHSGECEVLGDDLGGLAVHIGARVGALAGASEVLVSGTVCDLVVGSGLEFEEQGSRELRGVPGSWRICRLAGDRRTGAHPVAAAHPAAVAATPGAAQTMRPIDRAAVRIAKHAPSLARVGIRLSQRRRRSPTEDATPARH